MFRVLIQIGIFAVTVLSFSFTAALLLNYMEFAVRDLAIIQLGLIGSLGLFLLLVSEKEDK